VPAAAVTAVVLAAVASLLVACQGDAPPPQRGGPLDLPLVAWEGGAHYWDQFPASAKAGWNDPSFFPIASWHNGISNDAEVQYDKSLGFNTYIGLDPATPYRLLADNDVYWIGGRLNETFPENGKQWVGSFLDDEVDGRFPVGEGQRHLARLRDELSPDRPAYANFTQMVISRDMPDEDAEAFVNDFTDMISVDMYWYTVPFCDREPFRAVYVTPVRQATCRTSSSYGAVMDSLRVRDAADGKRQPLWQFVELLNGGPGEGPFVADISPSQLQGAVMNSLIHEARGIVYFDQSLTGPCASGNVVRSSQVDPGYCGTAQVLAAAEINARIHDLAPVLNSQSYVHGFGPGLDTMLKIHDGAVYVFAMVDSSDGPGKRRFRLPAGVDANRAEVLFEDRTVPIVDGTFTDSFPTEDAYHVYRIPLPDRGEDATDAPPR
jgi:hypothetical protein